MTDESSSAPRLIDPGDGGWASEPKVSQAELLLYGELAGPIRLLSQAAAAASDAYSLICKRLADREETSIQQRVLVGLTWNAFERVADVARSVASQAVSAERDRAEARNGLGATYQDAENDKP